MTSNVNEDKKVEKRPRGWNLRAKKGIKKDKNSPKFKKWLKRYMKSRSKVTRKRLEKLAKAPLPTIFYS